MPTAPAAQRVPPPPARPSLAGVAPGPRAARRGRRSWSAACGWCSSPRCSRCTTSRSTGARCSRRTRSRPRPTSARRAARHRRPGRGPGPGRGAGAGGVRRGVAGLAGHGPHRGDRAEASPSSSGRARGAGSTRPACCSAPTPSSRRSCRCSRCAPRRPPTRWPRPPRSSARCPPTCCAGCDYVEVRSIDAIALHLRRRRGQLGERGRVRPTRRRCSTPAHGAAGARVYDVTAPGRPTLTRALTRALDERPGRTKRRSERARRAREEHNVHVARTAATSRLDRVASLRERSGRRFVADLSRICRHACVSEGSRRR